MRLSTLGEFIARLLPSSVAPIIVGELSSLQTEGVAIHILDGYTNTEFLGMTTALYHPLVQIIFRFSSYPNGASKAQTVLDTLKGYHDEVNIQSLLPVGSILYLGQTEQKLHEFQLTFKVFIKE